MAYEIQFITDNKNGGKNKLQAMDRKLKTSIKKMDGIHLRELGGIREVRFMREELPEYERKIQWRKSYVVSKSTRKYSWNDVMKKINKIQAPHYKQV